MHWLLHLLVDAVLVFGLVASYCAYQEHRRKQSEYARVQLYEDIDKPCTRPFARTRSCSWLQQPAPVPPPWQQRLAQPRVLPTAFTLCLPRSCVSLRRHT